MNPVVCAQFLADLPNGTCGRVSRIDGGRCLKARLGQMGLFPGCPVEVLSNDGRGPVRVRVLGSQLSFGHGMAEKILIHPHR